MSVNSLKTYYSFVSQLFNNYLCLSKTKKVVAGLFLVGVSGWMIHRATGFSFSNIAPFSGIGEKAMRLFRKIFSSPQKPTPNNEASTPTLTSAPEKPLTLDTTSDEQLLQMITFEQAENGKPKELKNNPQNYKIRTSLKSKIHHGFTQHAQNGEEQVTNALAPLFASVKNDPDRFMLLVNLVIETAYSPRLTAAVLEKMEWPSETLKQEKLPHCLADYIYENCLEWQDDSIEIESNSHEEESKFFSTWKLLVITKNIFGHRNFLADPKTISPFLIQGMGIAIQEKAKDAIADLKQKYQNGNINEMTHIGLNLVIMQFLECRFPCSMIAPVLPYLKQLPGLVGLEISDVGGSCNTGHAFKDEDAPALLEIFRTNPYLSHVKINVNGMTPEKRETFLKEWQDIMTSRKKRPAIENLLTIEAPEKTNDPST